MNIESVLQRSLHAAFTKSDPFLILREAGLVAHLRTALVRASKNKKVRASLAVARNGKGLPKQQYTWRGKSPDDSPYEVKILSVQQEIRITGLSLYKHQLVAPRARNQARGGDKDRTDIVVFKEDQGQCPKLTCEASGPGDVVASIPFDGIACAIEVKACPTADGNQMLLVLKDIQRLYRMTAQKGLEAHMVLADKSYEAMFGAWSSKSAATTQRLIDWSGVAKVRKPRPTLHSLFQHPTKGVAAKLKEVDPKVLKLVLKQTRPSRGRFVTLHVAGLKSPLYVA